jgi:cyclase
MRRTRVIPVLLLKGRSLYKTRRFEKPVYVGDPINAVKIFNDKGVDELIVLDIGATREGRGPDLGYLREFAEECFVPLAYGGGISNVAQAEAVLKVGVEKIAINSAALGTPTLIREAAASCGSQSVVAAMDVKRGLFGGARVARTSPSVKGTAHVPAVWARQLADLGAGEILVNSVDRDGTGKGYDLEVVGEVAHAVGVPVIACGGAGSLADFREAVQAGAAAVAAGQMFVFHGRLRAVLINYPATQDLDNLLP